MCICLKRNNIEICTCAHPGMTEMDGLMTDTVLTLNRKGYMTKEYRSGNVDNHGSPKFPVIVFEYEYKFPSRPEQNFHIKTSRLSHDYDNLVTRVSIVSGKEKQNEKPSISQSKLKELNAELLQWAESLPECQPEYCLNPYAGVEERKAESRKVKLLLDVIPEGTKEYCTLYLVPGTVSFESAQKQLLEMLGSIENIKRMSPQNRRGYALSLINAQSEDGFWEWKNAKNENENEKFNYTYLPTYMATAFLISYYTNFHKEALLINCFEKRLQLAIKASRRRELFGRRTRRVSGLLLAYNVFLKGEVIRFGYLFYSLDTTFNDMMSDILYWVSSFEFSVYGTLDFYSSKKKLICESDKQIKNILKVIFSLPSGNTIVKR